MPKLKHRIRYVEDGGHWIVQEKLWWWPFWIPIGETVDILPSWWYIPLKFNNAWEAKQFIKELESDH